MNDKIEALAEQLHTCYLEACKKLHPESFNAKAQKEYKDLTDEQKFLDRYIATYITENYIPKQKAIFMGSDSSFFGAELDKVARAAGYIRKDEVELDREINIEIIEGVEGDCLSIENYRVSGNKPWGGGTIKQVFIAKLSDIREALCSRGKVTKK